MLKKILMWLFLNWWKTKWKIKKQEHHFVLWRNSSKNKYYQVLELYQSYLSEDEFQNLREIFNIYSFHLENWYTDYIKDNNDPRLPRFLLFELWVELLLQWKKFNIKRFDYKNFSKNIKELDWYNKNTSDLNNIKLINIYLIFLFKDYTYEKLKYYTENNSIFFETYIDQRYPEIKKENILYNKAKLAFNIFYRYNIPYKFDINYYDPKLKEDKNFWKYHTNSKKYLYDDLCDWTLSKKEWFVYNEIIELLLHWHDFFKKCDFLDWLYKKYKKKNLFWNNNSKYWKLYIDLIKEFDDDLDFE